VQELQTAVTAAGLRSALASQALKRPPAFKAGIGPDGKKIKKKRKERAVNMNKVTNAHLPSLFEGLVPKSIEER
jgi:hypothetical protein